MCLSYGCVKFRWNLDNSITKIKKNKKNLIDEIISTMYVMLFIALQYEWGKNQRAAIDILHYIRYYTLF